MNRLYLILSSLVLYSCDPSIEMHSTYTLTDKARCDAGLHIDHGDFGRHTLWVEPGQSKTTYASIKARNPMTLDYVIANLDDTISISVSNNEWVRILNEEIKSKRDTVIFNSFKRSHTFIWTVTDELVSVMEKDYALLDLFSEYYSQKQE